MNQSSCPSIVVQDRRPAQIYRLDEDEFTFDAALQNTAHLHRPWRAGRIVPD